MNQQTELTEMATELVALCNEAANSLDQNYNQGRQLVSRASAKGRLLVLKLGGFGAAWSESFPDPSKVEMIHDTASDMVGASRELQDALQKNRLHTLEERISASVLADLIEHAEILLSQHFNLAAAVVLRAVLEERLRKLCAINKLVISAERPTIEHFRQALVKGEVIDKITAKKVDWMSGVGNAAAHAVPAFNPADVSGLYTETLSFLEKFAA